MLIQKNSSCIPSDTSCLVHAVEVNSSSNQLSQWKQVEATLLRWVGLVRPTPGLRCDLPEICTYTENLLANHIPVKSLERLDHKFHFNCVEFEKDAVKEG